MPITNTYKFFWLVVVSIFITGQAIFGQTASITQGCFPLTVDFTADVAGTTFIWDFGDGTSSDKENPSNTFTEAGEYDVQLTVDGNAQPNILITVYDDPEPTFTVDTTFGCAPLVSSFTNTTLSQDGIQIQEVTWVFGDGGISSGETVLHTYEEGVFDLSMELTTNILNCNVTKIFPDVISATNPPQTAFTTDPESASACEAPLTVSFENTSTSITDLEFEWDMGNGNAFSTENVADQTYSELGVFPVSLTATDINQCSTTFTKNVNIGNPVAAFDNSIPYCVDVRSSIFNQSVGGNTYFWDFENTVTPTLSAAPNPRVTFSELGYSTIMLVAISEGGLCRDTVIDSVLVIEATAEFTSEPNYACSEPLAVQYTATNIIDGATYQWQFGDSTFAVGAVPDVKEYYVSRADEYYENGPVYLETILTVTIPSGCEAVASKIDSMFIPNTILLPDVVDGCIPLEVAFIDSSISNEDFVKWEWVFGDGTSVVTTTFDTVRHTYTEVGEYDAYVIVTNSEGCIDTSYDVRIKAGDLISPDFSTSQQTICLNDTVIFEDITTGIYADSIDTWNYSTNSNRSGNCFNEPNMDWVFIDEVGALDVTFEVGFNGCYSNETKAGFIDVQGPLAVIGYEQDCSSPLEVVFNDSNSVATDLLWDIESLGTFTGPDVNAIFSASGDYAVSLTVSDGSGCPVSVARDTVYIRQISASFESDTLLCQGTPYDFDASNSVDVATSCLSGYGWFFDDYATKIPQRTSNEIDSISFGSSGYHFVHLIVSDTNGCFDTVTQRVKVYEIDVNYGFNEAEICVPRAVEFTDSTTSDTTLTTWLWSFGDGVESTDATDVSHDYQVLADSNLFVTSLTVTNALGCVGTQAIDLPVYRPVPDAITYPAFNCVGDEIEFTAGVFVRDGEISPLTYEWDFRDGTVLTGQTVTHTYDSLVVGGFFLRVIEESTGCGDTISRNIFLQPYPVAGFESNVDTFSVLCYPQQVVFTDTSLNKSSNATINWAFSNGFSTTGSPIATTFEKGVFDVEMAVTNTYGCSDTAYSSLEVVGPEGIFETNIGNNTICRLDEVEFTIKDTSDVASFTWDFGDGTSEENISPVTHQYTFVPPSGQTTAKLVMSSQDGECPTTYQLPINLHLVIADFIRNNGDDSVSCALNFPLRDNSVGGDVYSWDFGDGQVSTDSSITSHVFPETGTYAVTLALENQASGCNDTVVKYITIEGFPELDVINDTICEGETGVLSVNDNDPLSNYTFTPLSLFDYDSIAFNAVRSTPDTTFGFQIDLVNRFGCNGVDTGYIIVVNDEQLFDEDYRVVIGDQVTLPMFFDGSIYNLTWQPDSGLSCLDCAYPITDPLLEDVTFSVSAFNPECGFRSDATYRITVVPETFVRFPDAFTPNGDGLNDVVHVRGWGIKELTIFQIFNRWGELIFETNDINQGWDGTHDGVLQNNDAYVYKVSVITWKDEEKQLEGYIQLMR